MKTAIIIIAIALIFFVLVGSVVLHLSGVMRQPRIEQQPMWNVSLAGGAPETLKAIDLSGDGQDEVFAQTPGQLVVFSAQGQPLFQFDSAAIKSTMGDLNGDRVDEFVVAEPAGDGLKATAFAMPGEPLWESQVAGVGAPARGLTLDFEGDGKREAVWGTDAGAVVVLDGVTGALRWEHRFAPDTQENLEVRGTDDVSRQGGTYLAAAVYGGAVILLDAEGGTVWELTFPEAVRRLRAYDMDGDGNSEILLGGLNGQAWLVSARDGSVLWQAALGSRVNEARFLEVDGDPTRIEVLVGTRGGGVFAYPLTGDRLWQKSVTGQVRELATLDYNEDGQNEVLVGADKLSLLAGPTGSLLATLPVANPTTLDVGDFGKQGAFLAGNEAGVSASKLSFSTPPLWSSPIPIGLLVALLIAAAAVVLVRLDLLTPVKTTYTVQEISLEALRARKKMLREVLEDVERMQREGQLSGEAYLERSRALHEQMAGVEGQLMQLQPDYKPELIKCPACSAPLEIGLDRCPHCGHVLL